MTNDRHRQPAFDADESEALQAIGWQPSGDESECPASSMLLAAEDGVLDDATADRVRAHVKSCATCQFLAKDLALVFAGDVVESDAARIRAQIAAGRRTGRTRPYVYVWGAGLAAAAALVWFVVAPKAPPAPVPDSPLARVTPPPVPSVFVVDRPAIPPGEIDLAVRGEAARPADINNQVALALDRADSGDVKGAIAELEALAGKHPESRRTALALGALQLREGRNAEALAALERARPIKTDAAMDDEVDWFLAMARVRAGDRTGARPLLEGVCKRAGVRSARACAGAAEIR